MCHDGGLRTGGLLVHPGGRNGLLDRWLWTCRLVVHGLLRTRRRLDRWLRTGHLLVLLRSRSRLPDDRLLARGLIGLPGLR